jgi:PAS domain S-box-containing protein
MLDGLTSGVLIVGADGRVKALNPAGEAILGRSRDDLLGRPAQEIFAASPELLALLMDGVRLGRAHAREVVACARPSLPPAHLGVTVSALPSATGRTGGAFCIFSDLTEIRGLQERVRLKESLAGLGEMSAGIAHEFRNALGTILGYARLLAREAGPAAEHGAAIAREVEGVGRIVDDFLRYARPARLQVSLWDPRAVIEDVAREVQRDGGRASTRIEVDGAWPPGLQADEALLRQAFQNLLKNALEATSQGGTVRVTGAHDAARGVLRVQIQDAGAGFPPDVLQRLFTPFVTTKPNGTGLGLAMAQKAVVCHDGAIDAVNSERGGACVTVILPLVAAASRPAAEAAAHG